MAQTRNDEGLRRAIELAVFALMTFMVLRLAVAGTIMAGKAIGWLEDGNLSVLQRFDPLGVDEPVKLAINFALAGVVLGALLASRLRAEK